MVTVYVGNLTDVFESYWSDWVNVKTHNFWAFTQFSHRLACICEEYSICLKGELEAWIS